jgi:8-oxo-dGTP pyrophosphatase MutT (NUDIX family)
MISGSGALIISRKTSRILLLQKKSGKNSGTWGLCGGTLNPQESSIQGLLREIVEEIGFLPDFIKTIPLEKFVSDDSGFNFYTYLCIVEDEFIPILSNEHLAWAWANMNHPPKVLHKGLYNSLKNKQFQLKITTILDIIDVL